MKNKEGWICPRCGKVNAPWVEQCSCTKDIKENQNKQEQMICS